MSFLLLVLLLITTVTHGLECIANCTLGNFEFDQSFRISDGQCQERVSTSRCIANLIVNYSNRTYSVQLTSYSMFSSFDSISITSNDHLIYKINYECDTENDCAVSYVQHRINEMIVRNYDSERIYSQIAPYIQGSSEGERLDCYKDNSEIIRCPPGDTCVVEYTTIDNKVQPYGCNLDNRNTGRVLYQDSGTFAGFRISCPRDFCNNMTLATAIKEIFIDQALIDSQGRRITAGMKETASFSLVTFALIFVMIFLFKK